jgi:hypothetical protein
LSTTNLTWVDLGSNSGRRGGKMATDRLSYGAAYLNNNFLCVRGSLSLLRHAIGPHGT